MDGTDIIFKLKKLIKKLEKVSTSLDFDEVTRSQLRIIYPIISDGRGYSMLELATKAEVDKAFVSRTIADLEKKGFVERDNDAGARSNYNIILTDKAKQFVLERRAVVQTISNESFGGITLEELQHFNKLLTKMIAE